MTESIPAHPAAELFPLLEGDEFDALVADISERGLTHPVWTYVDQELGEVILDGRNRARAMASLGIDWRAHSRRYTGDDPVGFSISENVKRRHLTTGQLAFVAHAALPLFEAEAAKRKAHGQTAPGRTLGADLRQASPNVDRALRNDQQAQGRRMPRAVDRAAKVAGASGRAVAQAKRVAEAAPDLAEKVKAGDLALDRAERIIRDREAEQRKVAEARAAAASAPVQATVDIRHGDFRDVLADLAGVHAIITDPPYPAEFLPLYDDLAAWADKVLSPDGVLVVLSGQTHLPEVYRRLDGHRPYRWTGCYLTAGAGYVSHPRRVQSNWKPFLVYGGGLRFSDVVRSVGSDDAAKSLHKWGQDFDAFRTLVERFTTQGQTVADPFMGSGTTLLAAHSLGRNAVGCDVDVESVDTARKRLA